MHNRERLGLALQSAREFLEGVNVREVKKLSRFLFWPLNGQAARSAAGVGARMFGWGRCWWCEDAATREHFIKRNECGKVTFPLGGAEWSRVSEAEAAS